MVMEKGVWCRSYTVVQVSGSILSSLCKICCMELPWHVRLVPVLWVVLSYPCRLFCRLLACPVWPVLGSNTMIEGHVSTAHGLWSSSRHLVARFEHPREASAGAVVIWCVFLLIFLTLSAK